MGQQTRERGVVSRDSITHAQLVLFSSTTPKELTTYLDKHFPGVTDRVSRGDLRAITLSSTALALGATASRLIDEQMEAVEKAWDDPIALMKTALGHLLDESGSSDEYALAGDEEE